MGRPEIHRRLALAAVLLALACAVLPLAFMGSEESDAEPLQEGDIVEMGARDLYVVLATKQYDDGDFGGYDGIYVVSNGAESIVEGAFSGCTSIRTVYMSSDVKGIGPSAFADTTNLSYVYGTGITHIDERAFENSGLESCYFNSNLSVIGSYAFKDCAGFNNFDFYKTSVTSLGEGTFMNCGIQCIDLRKVTYVHPTAFTGSDLTIQVVTTTQSALAAGVDRLYYDDTQYELGHVRCVDGTVTVEGDRLMFYDIEDEDGAPVDFTVRKVTAYVEYWTTFTVADGTDYYISDRGAFIDFPDDIGIEDVELPVGQTSYTLPTPTLGTLAFDHWEIEGLEGEFTSISSNQLISTKGNVTMVPYFGTAILLLDYSVLEGSVDTDEFVQSITFTYGDVYPEPGEAVGFRFTGWSDGGQVYQPGDRITNYTNHTAVGTWTETEVVTFDHSALDELGVPTSSLPGAMDIVDGDTVYPDLGEVGGYTHAGWYVDGEFVGIGSKVVSTESHTAYSAWLPPMVTITFMVEGEVYATLDVPKGSVGVVFTPEMVEGVFDGWFYDSLYTDRYDAVRVLEEDTVLYAKGVSPLEFTSDPYAVGTIQKVDSERLYYFDATESKGKYLVHWDFGDGNTSDGAIAYNTYESPGVYTVTLTVTNLYGESSVATYTVDTEGNGGGSGGGDILLYVVIALVVIVIVAYVIRLAL